MESREIVVEFSEDSYKDYRELQKRVLIDKERGVDNSFNMQLLKAIDRTKDNLKIDPQFGTHIPRKNVGKGATKRYGTDRLWKIDLVGYWRMIYTIIGRDVKVVAFVLEFMNHNNYNKIFGYKKR